MPRKNDTDTLNKLVEIKKKEKKEKMKNENLTVTYNGKQYTYDTFIKCLHSIEHIHKTVMVSNRNKTCVGRTHDLVYIYDDGSKDLGVPFNYYYKEYDGLRIEYSDSF